jgi:CheY-like chemotaxis protein/serine phosphatase RsbU (regulator of sigma subunit)
MSESIEILLADDSEVGRYVIATTLRRAGFEVREVPDGIEALHAALERPPDLAVLDVKMPGLNGLEVCSRMKADPTTSFVPVLLLSATFLDDEYRVEGLEIGADGYLTQPVEAPVLIASIRSLLRTRKAERAERLAANQWQVTFDAIGDPVALLEYGGEIRRCNRAFASLAGVEAADAVGRRIDDLLPELGTIAVGAVGVRDNDPNDRLASVAIRGREFACRVDELVEPESVSSAVVTLRDVTAERELERAREDVLRRERLISATLQEALAPGRLPAIQGLALSARYVLGEADVVVGGDWFDVIPTAGGVWLTVGDNAGHGVIATARAVQLRNNLRLLADEGYGPAEAMSRLSGLLDSGTKVELASAMIVALGRGGTAQIVCAGHPPSLQLKHDGRILTVGEVCGPVLGFKDVVYEAEELSVETGDTFVLYTDGLIERRNEPIDAGIARLIETTRGVEPRSLAEHAFSVLLPDTPTDDAAILVAQITDLR